MRAARARHARDPRHARRVLRASQRRRRRRHRARLRAGGGADPGRGGEAARQAGRDRRHPVRRRNRADDREGHCHRAEVRRRSRRAATRVVRCLRARALAQVRRFGLHLRPRLESDARPGHRSSRRARRHGGARRDCRDHGRRASARVAGDASGDGHQAHSDHHARRDRGAGARARHPRHAAVAGEYPRRADHHRGEVARRDAQGWRGRAARRRRRATPRRSRARG